MEKFEKSKSLNKRLNSGEEIKCFKCKRGIYRPFKPKASFNHDFICDICGERIHFIPDDIIVE